MKLISIGENSKKYIIPLFDSKMSPLKGGATTKDILLEIKRKNNNKSSSIYRYK